MLRGPIATKEVKRKEVEGRIVGVVGGVEKSVAKVPFRIEGEDFARWIMCNLGTERRNETDERTSCT